MKYCRVFRDRGSWYLYESTFFGLFKGPLIGTCFDKKDEEELIKAWEDFYKGE